MDGNAVDTGVDYVHKSPTSGFDVPGEGNILPASSLCISTKWLLQYVEFINLGCRCFSSSRLENFDRIAGSAFNLLEIGLKMDWPSSLIGITHREMFEWDALALKPGSAHELLAHSAADAGGEPDQHSQLITPLAEYAVVACCWRSLLFRIWHAPFCPCELWELNDLT